MDKLPLLKGVSFHKNWQPGLWICYFQNFMQTTAVEKASRSLDNWLPFSSPLPCTGSYRCFHPFKLIAENENNHKILSQ